MDIPINPVISYNDIEKLSPIFKVPPFILLGSKYIQSTPGYPPPDYPPASYPPTFAQIFCLANNRV